MYRVTHEHGVVAVVKLRPRVRESRESEGRAGGKSLFGVVWVW
jgi:hypothetical protein